MNLELDFSELIAKKRPGAKSAAQTPAKPEEKKKESVKEFNRADYEIFPFGGLFFFYDEKGGFLELPRQELSDWNRDLDRAKEILDNYLKRIKTAIENSDLNIKLKVGPKYSMKIYKV